MCSDRPTCYRSHHHTGPYVYSDAQHLLVRINCGLFGRPVPADSASAPLRFAPPPPEKPAKGPAACPAPGCSNNQGNPRQGSQKCIKYKCKTCCVDAANSAVRSGTYRDSCNTHNTVGVAGLPFPPPPAPVLQQHAPAPQQQLLHPNNAPPIGQPPAQQPVFANQVAGPNRNSSQAANRPGRPLARPLSNTWANQYLADTARPDPGKVVRQKADFITNNTISLVVYHS
ncbi:hypothetical protein C8R45DRAFT_1128249, partial [Mycena sanguinolenta]